MTIVSIILGGVFIYSAIVFYLYQKTEMPDLPDLDDDVWN